LTGLVVEEEADGTIVLDVGGVGYEVMVPLGALGRARANSTDGKVTLHVHSHVREDAFVLFGFPTSADRTVFRILLGISSVGPKTALAILSAFSAADLARVVSQRDVAGLTKVSGVGKKTAERLVLELKDKVDLLQQGIPAATSLSGPVLVKGAVAEQVISGLAGLGFKQAEAERAVASLGDAVEKASAAELLREALKVLRP
jgi:Holliday junction DNA helicase RuvA